MFECLRRPRDAFEVHGRLSGRTMWRVYDEAGRRVPVQDQHGRWLWGGWWSDNLITNVGLEMLASNTCLWQLAGQTYWRQYSQIGTGAAAPAFTDTALGAKVQSTNSDGGFAETRNYVVAASTIKLEYTLNHLHTMPADRNLTEYGYSPTDAAGATVIRELFRDQSNNPVTLTILNGKKLRITHQLNITLSPFAATSVEFEIEEYDTTNALTPKVTAATNAAPIQITTNVDHGLATGNKVRIQNVGGNTAANGTWVVTVVNATTFTLDGSTGNGAYTSGGEVIRRYVADQTWAASSINGTLQGFGRNSIFGIWDPANAYGNGLLTQDSGTISATETNSRDNWETSPAVAATSVVVDAYVAASNERVKGIGFNEVTANAAAYGWRFGQDATVGGQGYGGFKLKLTNPATYTKQSTHTLTVKMKSTWARA